MPIAHTCFSCGYELSRIAAPLDPVYRLPIVVCPGCQTPTVRRADGARAIPREMRLRTHAARKLVESLALLVTFSAGLVGMCFALQATLDDHRVPFSQAILGLFSPEIDTPSARWRNDVGLIALIAWLVFGMGAGAYLVAASPARRRWRIVALWAIVAAGTVFLSAAVVASFEANGAIRSARTARSTRFIPPELNWWVKHVHEVFLGAAGAMILGLPLGFIIRRRLDGFAARRFRRLRKRIIARRHRT
ncbi:MAG: hypothetical protein ACK4WH_06645 [Phycisphaerales bacterium]